MNLVVDGQSFSVELRGDLVLVNGTPYTVRVQRFRDVITVYVNERPFCVQLPTGEGTVGEQLQVLVDARYYQVEAKGRKQLVPSRPAPERARPKPLMGSGTITAPVAGRVVRVEVHEGQEVAEGQLLLIIEAMKMENEIRAPMAGRVKQVLVQAGARVAEGEPLVVLEPA